MTLFWSTTFVDEIGCPCEVGEKGTVSDTSSAVCSAFWIFVAERRRIVPHRTASCCEAVLPASICCGIFVNEGLLAGCARLVRLPLAPPCRCRALSAGGADGEKSVSTLYALNSPFCAAVEICEGMDGGAPSKIFQRRGIRNMKDLLDHASTQELMGQVLSVSHG